MGRLSEEALALAEGFENALELDRRRGYLVPQAVAFTWRTAARHERLLIEALAVLALVVEDWKASDRSRSRVAHQRLRARAEAVLAGEVPDGGG